MTDLGLLSLLGPAHGIALALLLVAFGVEVGRTRPATGRLAVPVVTCLTLVHGTPAVLYGTLRYSWAWKHLGIVDYISRRGTVDPDIAALDVYHNWPGFFAQTAALLELAGIDDPSRLASWWPVVTELATVPVLLMLFSAFGSDRRTRWTAVLLFLCANWVGQDYFSPQSEAFVLYLAVVALVLRRFPRRPRRRSTLEAEVASPASWSGSWSVVVIVALTAAIVTSHQITPFMLCVAMGSLALTRRVRSTWLVGAGVAMAGAWIVTGARTYMFDNLRGLASTVGQPVGNADDTLIDTSALTANQQLVSTMGRVTVLVIGVAALLGIARQLRGRRLRTEAVVLATCPALMVVTNNFDGEIIFRTYLFALPFLAWLAADGIWNTRPSAARSVLWLRPVATVVVAAVLLCGFLFGYYGKDQWFYFTPDEVTASELVLSEAPPGSLLVTGTTNYPGQFKNYERFTYVPIASEPADGQRELAADPAGKLEDWLSEPQYRGAYVLITRSQKDEVEATGLMARGSLDRIETDLHASDRFEAIFDTPEATVFVLRPGER